jgi:hypothetical protein
MRRTGMRHAINFAADDNFPLRITHELSNSFQEIFEWKKTAQ